MKPITVVIVTALLVAGCVQGGQQAPPPSTAVSPAPPIAAASAPASAAPAAVTETSESVPAPKAATGIPATQKPAEPVAAPPVEKPAPTAPPAAPAPTRERVRMIVPDGTLLPLEIQTTVSTAHSHEGDPVLAVLTEDIPLKGFKLDKGAEVRGKVLVADSAKRVKGRAHLVVGFDAVMKNGERLVIATENIDSMAKSTSSTDKKIIGGAAADGLIIGAIKDGGKGAAIGALIGAAAGGGAVLIMKGDEVELPRGAKITVAVTK